jgi:hypothetical protein
VVQSSSGYAEMKPPKVWQGVRYVGLIPSAYKSRTIGYCYTDCRLAAGFLFICNPFNDAVNNSDYIASNFSMTINYGIEKMWEKAVLAWFKVYP